jgi:hypothetical protein
MSASQKSDQSNAQLHTEARQQSHSTNSTSDGNHIAQGVVIAAGTVLGKRIDVSANVVFVDTRRGLSSDPSIVQDEVQIGANSTIYPGVTLGARCVVRPGSVVKRSVPPAAIVEGNPAMIVGYVNAESDDRVTEGRPGGMGSFGRDPTAVKGVELFRFPVIEDLRGNLTVGEFETQIPFVPLRYFMVFGVPGREVRGEHAHRECHQFLICASGSCTVMADDGAKRVETILDSPGKAIHLPPMTWGVQYKYSADAVLLVFASHHYDSGDYIRDYEEFLSLVNERAGKD